jgi:hypothetical protein
MLLHCSTYLCTCFNGFGCVMVQLLHRVVSLLRDWNGNGVWIFLVHTIKAFMIWEFKVCIHLGKKRKKKTSADFDTLLALIFHCRSTAPITEKGKLRSWVGPNGQYYRELPCPSCRGRGYTPCKECGIDRSSLDCPMCNGKVNLPDILWVIMEEKNIILYM